MKGQVSLEWLILIGTVLVVAGLVVYLTAGTAGTQSKAMLFASCKQAATTCKINLRASGTDPCYVCTEQCQDPSTGNDLLKPSTAITRACAMTSSACSFCKQGRPDLIYESACIKNQGPTAEANGPYTCTKGSSCTLNSSGSRDPDGNLSYLWVLKCSPNVILTIASGGFTTGGLLFSGARLQGFEISGGTGQQGQGQGFSTGTDTGAGTGLDTGLGAGTGIGGTGLGGTLLDDQYLISGTFGWPGVTVPLGATTFTTANPSFTPAATGSCNVTLYVKDDCVEIASDTTTITSIINCDDIKAALNQAGCDIGTCSSGGSCKFAGAFAAKPCYCR